MSATILQFLQADHRACDDHLAKVEQAMDRGDILKAKELFTVFVDQTLHHFDREEDILFPEFEHKSGITTGPTQMMRQEHEQVRGLLERMHGALEVEDVEGFLGISETLNILLQQHNMKEEQILYPSCDRVLGTIVSQTIDRMKAL
jgi:iron-sulfur cluster repair protein YtfE (RIC family)